MRDRIVGVAFWVFGPMACVCLESGLVLHCILRNPHRTMETVMWVLGLMFVAASSTAVLYAEFLDSHKNNENGRSKPDGQ